MKQCADYRIADDGEESANEQESKLSEETRRKHMRLASRVQNFLGCLYSTQASHIFIIIIIIIIIYLLSNNGI